MKHAIIIPTKNDFKLIKNAVESIVKFTKGIDYTIFVVDTGSNEEVLNSTKKLCTKHKCELLLYNWYQFGKLNNEVAYNLPEEYQKLCFVNNDVVLIEDTLSLLSKVLDEKNIGTVGCKLLFENKKIQHAGMCVVNKTKVHFSHRGLNQNSELFSNQEKIIGNTAALMGINRETFNRIGGFDETTIECYDDVILNLKCLILGLDNVYCGQTWAYHLESQTRKKEEDKTKKMVGDLTNVLVPFVQNNKNRLSKWI